MTIVEDVYDEYVEVCLESELPQIYNISPPSNPLEV
jgi:hypothetical protein